MSKQPPLRVVKKPGVRKVDTAIIVALIALIGTLATALFNSPVILEWIRHKQISATVSPVSLQAPSNSSNASTDVSVTPLSGRYADCLTNPLADIQPARQISLEVGASNQDYSISNQDLANNDFHGPIGIKLTQNGKMIAALSFLYFSDNRLFKIISLVDSNCQAVAEYSNWDRGGDRNVIGDSETLKFKVAEGSFSLRFIFWGPGILRFNFQ